MPLLEDELLEGAVDLHAHVYPEFTLRYRPRMDDLHWLRMAAAVRMGAVVLKSHMWPTTDLAYNYQEFVKPLRVYGGVALNSTVGGLNPLVCDIVGESGGRIVWMPTWSAANDQQKGRIFLSRMKKYLRLLEKTELEGIRILDDRGRLRREVEDIIDVCLWHDMVLASGHLSTEESLVLAQRAGERGVRFLLNHPLSRAIDASIEAQRRISDMGGFIEHCFITTMPMHQRVALDRIHEAILAVGPERCIMSTDSIQAWNPPEPELMRMFVSSLLELGVEEAAIRLMVRDNPRQLLNWQSAET